MLYRTYKNLIKYAQNNYVFNHNIFFAAYD